VGLGSIVCVAKCRKKLPSLPSLHALCRGRAGRDGRVQSIAHRVRTEPPSFPCRSGRWCHSASRWVFVPGMCCNSRISAGLSCRAHYVLKLLLGATGREGRAGSNFAHRALNRNQTENGPGCRIVWILFRRMQKRQPHGLAFLFEAFGGGVEPCAKPM
jgi:hypothetical protein